MNDPAVRTGVLWQAIAALWSCRDLVRALREPTPAKLPRATARADLQVAQPISDGRIDELRSSSEQRSRSPE
jgi:hypothetical protein